MRAKAIVKICICGTIALVLASVLVSLLAIPRVQDWKIGDLSLHWIDDHGGDEGYTVGEASVSGEVRELDVSWLSGSVTVELTDGDAVTLREEPQPESSDARMRWKLQDGKLTVYSQKSGLTIPTRAKQLTIGIPAGRAGKLQKLSLDLSAASASLPALTLRELELDSVSGSVTLTGGSYENLDFDSTSGDLTVTDAAVGELSADTTSGSLTLDGAFETIDFDTTSGALHLTTSILPQDISCDTVSGGVTLTLPENGGFSATLDSVSGDLTVDGFAGSLHRDTFVYGQGGPAYEFDSVSGDVHIRCA